MTEEVGGGGGGGMSISVMTTTNPDDSLTTAMHGNNQTLHNTLWNILPLMLQCRKIFRKCLKRKIPPAQTPIQRIPQMFYLVYMWRTGRHG